jgi:hypothetical protein
MNGAALAVFETVTASTLGCCSARTRSDWHRTLSLPSIDTFHRSARKKYVKVAFSGHFFVARSAQH